MSLFPSALPTSLRSHQNAEPSSFARNLMVRAQRSADGEIPAIAVKSRFAPMPHEPEDAKITGGTRSLDRRLLALNLPPLSRLDRAPMAVKRVA